MSEAGTLNQVLKLKELSKSGIVSLVLISVVAGFLLSVPLELAFSAGRMILTLAAIMLLASGSSALNQFQESIEDSKMDRTKGRPIPSGTLSPKVALAFIVLAIGGGFSVLTALNPRAGILGGLAVILYNGFYTRWWKRKWAFAAVPGAVPGALPILIGSVCADGRLDSLSGWYLFAVLFFWQMPHFWCLALKYSDDYAKGGFPTLPVVYGERATLFQITIWTFAYMALALIGPFFLQVGVFYFVVSVLMSIKITQELVLYLKKKEQKNWLRFFLWINFSLIIYLAAAVIDRWHVYLVPRFSL